MCRRTEKWLINEWTEGRGGQVDPRRLENGIDQLANVREERRTYRRGMGEGVGVDIARSM